MDPKDLLCAAFWNSTGGAEDTFDAPVAAAWEAQPSDERPSCTVQHLALCLADGRLVRLVAKHVDLRDAASFRDRAHQKRRRDAYSVETAFYQRMAVGAVKSGLRLPYPVYMDSSPNPLVSLTVAEDLAYDPRGSLEAAAAPVAFQAASMREREARAALAWLAEFHARWWNSAEAGEPGVAGVWRWGTYWTLEATRGDLEGMDEAWRRTSAAFSVKYKEAFQVPGVRGLGKRLRSAAERLHGLVEGRGGWRTLVHGDCKSAHFFFREGGEGGLTAWACSFKWMGGGQGVRDVVHLLWSSLEPDVVAGCEEALLRHYVKCVKEALAANGQKESARQFLWGPFAEAYDAAYLDYVRALVGREWARLTPAECASKGRGGDVPMYCRDAGHLVEMALKANELLGRCERRLASGPRRAEERLAAAAAREGHGQASSLRRHNRLALAGGRTASVGEGVFDKVAGLPPLRATMSEAIPRHDDILGGIPEWEPASPRRQGRGNAQAVDPKPSRSRFGLGKAKSK
ncbi:unnamed protein product, partial [Ostreobium quekettii]